MLQYGIFNDLTDEELKSIRNTPDEPFANILGAPIVDGHHNAILRKFAIESYRDNYRETDKSRTEPILADARFRRPVGVKVRKREVIYGDWEDD